MTDLDLRYLADVADIRPEVCQHIDVGVIRRIDGTNLYGFPIREMTKTELMCMVVVLGAQLRRAEMGIP